MRLGVATGPNDDLGKTYDLAELDTRKAANMRSLMVLGILFASTPLILFTPHLGILAWTWVSYMNPHRLTWGAAFDFPVAEIVAIPTLIGWVISRDPKQIPRHPLIYLLVAYLAFVTVTTMHSYHPEMAWDKWEKFLKICLFTVLTASLMRSQVRLHALIWTVVLSVGYFAWKGGLFTAMTAGAYIVWGPPGTFFADNNHMGLTALMILPLLRYLQMQAQTRLGWWVTMGMLGLNLLCVFGTQSRGALVGLVAMIGYLMLRTRQFGALVVAVFALGIGFLFMPGEYQDRMASIADYENDPSAQGRFDMWKYAIKVANDSPLLGGGFEVFYHGPTRDRFLEYDLEEGQVKGRAAHSIFFEVLGEHGYVGLFLFIALGFSTFLNVGKIRKEIKGRGDLKWCGDLASMLQLSIIAYATSGAFLTLATFDLYYHVIAMTVITHLIVREKLKEAPGADKPSDQIFDHVMGLFQRNRRKTPGRAL